MSVWIWAALMGAVALIVVAIIAGWKLSRASDRKSGESHLPPVRETGAKARHGGGAGLRSVHALTGHAGSLTERAAVTKMQARRTWRTRLGFALFLIALVFLIGATVLGVVMIRAFWRAIPSELESTAPAMLLRARPKIGAARVLVAFPELSQAIHDRT
jgi:hypothetical protein